MSSAWRDGSTWQRPWTAARTWGSPSSSPAPHLLGRLGRAGRRPDLLRATTLFPSGAISLRDRTFYGAISIRAYWWDRNCLCLDTFVHHLDMNLEHPDYSVANMGQPLAVLTAFEARMLVSVLRYRTAGVRSLEFALLCVQAGVGPWEGRRLQARCDAGEDQTSHLAVLAALRR